jgi:hypothetical protein
MSGFGCWKKVSVPTVPMLRSTFVTETLWVPNWQEALTAKRENVLPNPFWVEQTYFCWRQEALKLCAEILAPD